MGREIKISSATGTSTDGPVTLPCCGHAGNSDAARSDWAQRVVVPEHKYVRCKREMGSHKIIIKKQFVGCGLDWLKL